MMIDPTHIIQGLYGLVLMMLGAFAKYLHGETQKNKEALAAFKEDVAKQHPTHDSIDRRFDKLDEKLDRLTDKIDAAISRRREAERE